MSVVQDTAIQIAATRLPSVGLCGVLVPSDFHLFGLLKKHLVATDAKLNTEVHEALVQWFCLQIHNSVLKAYIA
jgi:hypothetical protein